MSKEETFYDRLSRGVKISCTAHDEILGGKNPCAIVESLYKQLAELKAENEKLTKATDPYYLQTIKNLEAENERLKEDNEELLSTLRRSDNYLLCKNIERLQQQLKDKDKEIAQNEKDMRDMNIYNDQLRKENEKLSAENTKLRVDIELNTKRIIDILDKIDQHLSQDQSFLKGYIRGAKDRLKSGFNDIKPLIDFGSGI